MGRGVEHIEADIELHLKTSACCISQKNGIHCWLQLFPSQTVKAWRNFGILDSKSIENRSWASRSQSFPSLKLIAVIGFFRELSKDCYPTHWSPTRLLVIFLVNLDNNRSVKLNAETMMRRMSWEIKMGRAQPRMRIQNQRARMRGQRMKLLMTKMMKNRLPWWVLPRACTKHTKKTLRQRVTTRSQPNYPPISHFLKRELLQIRPMVGGYIAFRALGM